MRGSKYHGDSIYHTGWGGQFSIRRFNIPWMKIDPGVNLPWGSKYHMTLVIWPSNTREYAMFYARGSNQSKCVIMFKPGIKLKIIPLSPAFESCFAKFLLIHQFASFFHPKQISVILVFHQNQNIWHVSMKVCWNLKKNIINTKI